MIVGFHNRTDEGVLNIDLQIVNDSSVIIAITKFALFEKKRHIFEPSNLIKRLIICNTQKSNNSFYCSV